MAEPVSRTATTGLRRLFSLDPDVIYLNHGSFGACPKPVFDAYVNWQRELERQPVGFFARRTDLLREAREKLGAYVGAEADDLVYARNVTMAINIVARSLKLQPGDEILTTDQEYGSTISAWQCACEAAGAVWKPQATPCPVCSQEELVEAIWSGVTERTRVLFLSHITWSTATILPVTELVRRAREAGILSVIDGAHAVAQVPLDLGALDPDYYAGSCHKWMMAPKGSSFLYAREDKQDLLEQLVVTSGRNVQEHGRARFLTQQGFQGTQYYGAYLAVPETIAFMEEHDWPMVRQECHALAQYTRARLEEITGLPALVPDSDEFYAQMATLPLPACDTGALYKRLWEEYCIVIPIIQWRDRCLARLSVQGYNTQEDVDALLRALEAILPQVTTVENANASD